jgi:glycogen debranching enzyme
LSVSERERDERHRPKGATRSTSGHRRREHQRASDGWVARATEIRSDSVRLNAVLDRSLRDLHLLQTTLRGGRYFAAGVPWYVTLFGRDSIISAIESLPYLPDSAEDTVRLLASYQGTAHDEWRDEEPGKIMHELRVGEMAHLHEIPQTPYYGSVDATPLFLILLAQHHSWTGRLDLFNEVRRHVDAALHWIDEAIAQGGTGYLTYATKSKKGLANQGWKDSGDAIVNRDGTLATPPIALVEVQAYVFLAKRGIADLYRRAGDITTADRLVAEADELRDRFEHDFWIEELGTYALALQRDNLPAAVVASNPGHALWAGIVSASRANAVRARLMRDDMFSGWGIRTLSADERRYNPIGYHRGTVWPHDNALAAAGFARYGCGADAARITGGIVDAADCFDHSRLPEVFGGFSRSEFPVPVHYPVACHPQAWAAGAVPFMVTSLLGLEPDAFGGRLRIRHPQLPPSVGRIEVRRLRVGSASVSVTFARAADDGVVVDDVHVDGSLEVIGPDGRWPAVGAVGTDGID